MVKRRVCEVPPPGMGLKTVTLTLPEEAIRDAGTQATNWSPLMKEVARGVLFHTTQEESCSKFEPFKVQGRRTKFEPFMINSKAGPPAFAEVGKMEVIVGRRLLAPVTVKSTEGDEGPEVGKTATEIKPPGAPMSAPLTCPVSVWHGGVPFIGQGAKVVGIGEPSNVSASFALKFVPVTVRLNEGPPARTLGGEREEIMGPPD
jgi:hypothetical protein